jgi:RNA polymerase sigma factor (TIGR02999 family)
MASSDDTPETPNRPPRDEPPALEALTPALYAELRKLAVKYLRRERVGHTLQPTALVHEAYLRMIEQRELAWQNRAQVLGLAALLMRRILVSYARARTRVKRDGLLTRVSLDGLEVAIEQRDVDVMALDAALRELAAVDEQLSRVVELRYFGGLTVEETAEVLATSPRTVERTWAMARAWLRRRLEGGEQRDGDGLAEGT